MKTNTQIELVGVDVNLEISLKEYGIAWHEEDNQIIFIYGIKYDGEEFTRFDKCDFDKNVSIKEHFNWIDASEWQSFKSFAGIEEEIETLPLEYVIPSLVSYFGTENVFGSIYFEGDTFEDLREKYEINL